MLEEQKKQSRLLKSVSKVLVEDSRPRAPSGKSEREHHQADMKLAARTLYNCNDPLDASVIKCMILGSFFPSSKVTCSHIIGLRNRSSLARLGLSDTSLWDARNCLLLFHEFEPRFENLEIVS